jgi:hypothetical protein
VWRRGRLVRRGVEDRPNSVRVLDTFLRQCEWPFPWIVWVGWIARAAPAPRFTKQAWRRSGRSSEERARALSSCDNPKGPCKKDRENSGGASEYQARPQCRVQSADGSDSPATVERRLQDNARLAPGARGKKLRFTLLEEAGWQRAEA